MTIESKIISLLSITSWIWIKMLKSLLNEYEMEVSGRFQVQNECTT
jgi:hypothetical protein